MQTKDNDSAQDDLTVEREITKVQQQVNRRATEESSYDRDVVRRIAEEFSQKYVSLIRSRG